MKRRPRVHRPLGFTLLALGVLLLTAPQGVAAQEGTSPGVRPGDKVTIAFYTAAGNEMDEIAGERIVDRNGKLFLPFVGTVAVAGLDADGIRRLLTERYAEYFADPVIEVTVQIKVNVTGAVRNPGSYFLDPSSTVIDAIAEAGGTGTGLDISGQFGGAADISAVRLVRDGVPRIVDLDPDRAGIEVVQMPVFSGDWIHVPPKSESRLREDIQFWGGVVSLVGGVVAVFIALGG
ncbi:MAG: hypothetical protein D6701_03455 [Gemmatimonadetes bacterium]|nr:MAG: hypothetical protein D6701_03455 [Gemmatimonadota bacterium]